MPLILVTGGARGGKSDFAQNLAAEIGGDDVLFVATAEARDDEMARRIAAHREARPSGWRTVEAPRQVGRALREAGGAKAVVVDCLTLLVSNVLLSVGDEPSIEPAIVAVEEEIGSLLAAASETARPVIVVTNEVGFGIVPANALARTYRDLLGRANAAVAREAEQVYLLVSGIAVEIKSLSRR
jgi:adenosylcobinamide kinase / adenosylcobinamide-phosphate guanylyltransferase